MSGTGTVDPNKGSQPKKKKIQKIGVKLRYFFSNFSSLLFFENSM